MYSEFVPHPTLLQFLFGGSQELKLLVYHKSPALNQLVSDCFLFFHSFTRSLCSLYIVFIVRISALVYSAVYRTGKLRHYCSAQHATDQQDSFNQDTLSLPEHNHCFTSLYSRSRIDIRFVMKKSARLVVAICCLCKTFCFFRRSRSGYSSIHW